MNKRHWQRRAMAAAAAGLVGVGLGEEQATAQTKIENFNVRLTLQDVQRLAKIGYRDETLDYRFNDIGYIQDYVIYTTHYIVFKSKKILNVIDISNFVAKKIEIDIKSFIGIDGEIYGQIGGNLGAINLENNSIKIKSIVEKSTVGIEKTPSKSILTLYSVSKKRIYFNLYSINTCNIYGVLKLGSLDEVWKINECLSGNSVKIPLLIFQGEGYGIAKGDYLYIPPGRSFNQELVIYDIETAKKIDRIGSTSNLFLKAKKIIERELYPTNISSNYFLDSICKPVDPITSRTISEYMSVKHKFYFPDRVMKCGNSLYTVLWSSKPNNAEIQDTAKAGFQITLIGGRR